MSNDFDALEKEQSRLVRKRHGRFSVWRLVIAAFMFANSGLVIARFDGWKGYAISAVCVLIGLYVLETIRMRANMYRDLLHSFSHGMFSSRIAHELSENVLWDDQDDRRQYEALVEEWKKSPLMKVETNPHMPKDVIAMKSGKSFIAVKNLKPGGK